MKTGDDQKADRRRRGLTILAEIEMEGYSFRCRNCESTTPFDKLQGLAADPPECCGEGMVLVTPTRPAEEHNNADS